MLWLLLIITLNVANILAAANEDDKMAMNSDLAEQLVSAVGQRAEV